VNRRYNTVNCRKFVVLVSFLWKFYLRWSCSNWQWNYDLNLSHYVPWRRLWERRYSSYSFSTSAIDGGEWSASCPGRAIAPGKGPPVPIIQEAGWAPEPVWSQRLEEKSFRPCRGSNPERPLVQHVTRHYSDWATRLTKVRLVMVKMCNYSTSRTLLRGMHLCLKVNTFKPVTNLYKIICSRFI
jgi:hypothetical protein